MVQERTGWAGRIAEPLVSRERHWTAADLADLPDDGHRYEIVDGVLVVSGSPRMRHQRAVFRLARVLDDACPAGQEVFVAPFAVVLAFDTVMHPDVLVARSADLTETELPAPPVLAVEMLSPGSGMVDRELKPGRLARAGTPSYWLVDPAEDPAKARLIVHRLGPTGQYEQVADVVGTEAYRADAPFAVTVVPAELVRDVTS
jgi:Uma2 family endonuclease